MANFLERLHAHDAVEDQTRLGGDVVRLYQRYESAKYVFATQNLP